ncbi:MAG: hypothetical protein QM594_00165 [Niabella sp.]
MNNILRCLFHNEEFDDSVFFDGAELLHVGFRKILIEIKTEDLSPFTDLLRHIANNEELWNHPETGSVMVETPIKGLSLLLLRPEAERLKYMLEVSENELTKLAPTSFDNQ